MAKKINWILLTIFVIFFTIIHKQGIADSYLFGIFGVPELETYEKLYKEGLDHYFIRHREVKDFKRLVLETSSNPKSIYVLGLNPHNVNNLKKNNIALKKYSHAKEEIKLEGVYIADDVKCKHRKNVLDIAQKLKKDGYQLLVGDLSKKLCYKDSGLDVLTYRYPAMRYEYPLSQHFKDLVDKSNIFYSSGTKNYQFTQSHFQDWYKELLNCSNSKSSCEGKYYPDGQLIRLFIYINLLSGSDGQYLYNAVRLKGDKKNEKINAILQTLIETKILRNYINNLISIDYHKNEYGIYGSVAKYPRHRITSYFLDSKYAPVHPSTHTKLVNLINNDIYYYDNFCWNKIQNRMYVSEHVPLITTNAIPETNHLCSTRNNNSELNGILKKRIKFFEDMLPVFSKNNNYSLTENYIRLAQLNEQKRIIWLKHKNLNYNAENLNREYWKSKRNNTLSKFRKRHKNITPFLNFYTILQFKIFNK